MWHARGVNNKQPPTAENASNTHAHTCRGVAYHGKECQRVHWRAGHRHQCQPVDSGGLDWAAELQKAEAGLAAGEQDGGASGRTSSG